MLHKRTRRRENTEGSHRVEVKDKKEMSGKLKTKDTKGNNIPQMRKKRKDRNRNKIYIQEALSARDCFLSSSDKKHFYKEELNQAWKVHIT